MNLSNLQKIDAIVESALQASRIPGAAVAVVLGERTVFAKGYGVRNLAAASPMTAGTVYPIASTSKAMNATVLGMLVDAGRLAWDAPVQEYLPRFRLHDVRFSASVTVRDLVVMRTGLPRHDFLWMQNPINRTQLVDCLAHLALSAGFRERFQYNNLTAALAGHIAEVITGRTWQELVRERILQPLGMTATSFAPPPTGNVVTSYHEGTDRVLRETRWLETEPIAPAGGTIHSTVEDMTRWLAFNLNGGSCSGQQLISPATLEEIHSPCIAMGSDSVAPSDRASYGFGWFIDTYNGHARLSHTGYLHDVNGCVTLFPERRLGIVSFNNFASARLAAWINEQIFDATCGLPPVRTLTDVLAHYETQIATVRRRVEAARRVADTSPSQPLSAYSGRFTHPGYGAIEIRQHGTALSLVRDELVLPLEHWHYDAWVVASNDWFEIHKQHPFDRANRLLFETDADGEIGAFTLPVEPSLGPARFTRERFSTGGVTC
jgi:CubicO group peptidase (beta-lactamase class C family)